VWTQIGPPSVATCAESKRRASATRGSGSGKVRVSTIFLAMIASPSCPAGSFACAPSSHETATA
jgi:hypothetical protein